MAPLNTSAVYSPSENPGRVGDRGYDGFLHRHQRRQRRDIHGGLADQGVVELFLGPGLTDAEQVIAQDFGGP